MKIMIVCVSLVLGQLGFAHAQGPHIRYFIEEGGGQDQVFASGRGSQLRWDYGFGGHSKQRSDYRVDLDAQDPLLWTLRLKGPLATDEHILYEFGLQGELKEFPQQEERILTWVRHDAHRERLLKASLVRSAFTRQTPMRFQRAVLPIDDYQLVLYRDQSQTEHRLKLWVWNSSEEDSDYKQEWTFVDVNDDQQVDRVELRFWFKDRAPQKQTWYKGSHFIKGFIKQYHSLFTKEAFYQIGDDEMGVYTFTGEKHGLSWKAFEGQHALSFLLEWLHQLYQKDEFLLVDEIAPVDTELLSLLKSPVWE